MSIDKQGQIAGSPVSYDVGIDDDLNVKLAILLPLPMLADLVASKANNPVLTEVEKTFIMAAKLYVSSQTKPAA